MSAHALPPRRPLAPDELQALLDAAPGIHLLTDAGGVILASHGAHVADLGAAPSFIPGRPLVQFVVPASRTLYRSMLERGETEQPVLLDLRGRRSVFVASVSVRRVGDLLVWTITLEPGRSPSQIQPTSPPVQLRYVFERLSQGIVVVDRALTVLLANPAARRLVGPKLRAGRRLDETTSALGLHEHAARLFADEEVVDILVSPDGATTYSVTGIPPQRKGDDVVLVITDVSVRERAQRVERDFVTNASHELRTPLATITGAIEILQAGAKDVPEARDRFLSHIEREVARLGRLVNALLVLARVQAAHELPELTAVVLRPLLDEVAGSIAAAPAVDVVVSCPAKLAVLAHPDLLLEVISNLASNAAKHTERGRIVLWALGSRETATVEVRDSGPGIDPEEQANLFTRFYRGRARSADGFGLGLAIVGDAVSALGGGIEVDSAPGAGTTFRVTLPLAKGTA